MLEHMKNGGVILDLASGTKIRFLYQKQVFESQHFGRDTWERTHPKAVQYLIYALFGGKPKQFEAVA